MMKIWPSNIYKNWISKARGSSKNTKAFFFLFFEKIKLKISSSVRIYTQRYTFLCVCFDRFFVEFGDFWANVWWIFVIWIWLRSDRVFMWWILNFWGFFGCNLMVIWGIVVMFVEEDKWILKILNWLIWTYVCDN